MKSMFTFLIIAVFSITICNAQTAAPRANQTYLQTSASSSSSSSTRSVATPGATLRAARTIYLAPSSRLDVSYVQYKLLKTTQLAAWQIQIVQDARQADLILSFDQVRLNYLFTLTDPRTSAVIVSGKVVAVNDPVAADFLGIEIIKRMREVRGLD